MARAVIGGLITSTLLTLVVVPVVYTYLDGFGSWAGALVRRWNRTPDEEHAAQPEPREPQAVPAD
jgi:HAE1 family hydrophobic/amphiphilic exporter-1